VELREKKPSKSLFKKEKSASKSKLSATKKSKSAEKLALVPEEKKVVVICEIPVPLDNTIKWRQPLCEVDSRGTAG
jgi:hypothetical protein